MATLKDIIYYILKKYPNKKHLSNARLTKLIYLIDWYSAIHYNKQISNIKWYFDNYGPFVWDVLDEIKKNPKLFKIKHTTNFFGNNKKIIENIENNYNPNINDHEKQVINKIIDITKDKNWSAFINLVYSTYPILVSEKYSYLNLINKAKKFRELKKLKKDNK
ncbi:Panacea domain-containing protein [Nitratiruptor sp. SB155-2]|uniref:Panacea domain-containing protein n=1 Tax=Nitratiruptor sp. (strain SB155-2) TaxID=387092 RepID=UPI000158733E|nr:Panacea domain-containing protein [Nitratiruptor sp. SB155-2]BAF69858.1 hypothetical protein NIS_0745 [Nitratiruptor sp. SB155-2]